MLRLGSTGSTAEVSCHERGSPVNTVRRLILLLVVVAVALRLSGVELHAALLWVAAGAEASIVLLAVYGLARVIRDRALSEDGEGTPRGWDALRNVLRESLPEGVAEAVLSEARVVVAAMRSITLRSIKQLEQRPGWRRFGAMETSSYGNTVTMLMLLVVLEAPGVHLLIGASMEEGPLRDGVRGVLLGSSIYLAIWLIGDLRLLRETPGVLLGSDILAVEMGVRAQGQVSLDTVAGAQLLGEPRAVQGCAVRAIRVSPQPRPNCRIQLRSAVTLRGLVGIPVTGEALDLYVDDPSGLVRSVEKAIAHRPTLAEPPQASMS